MQFTTPLIIDVQPTQAEYTAQFPANARHAHIAYSVAVKVWLRTRLSSEQNHRCAWCGCATTEQRRQHNSSTIEHVQPLSMGGADEYDNMVMACSACNGRRGVKTVEVFMKIIADNGVLRRPMSSRRQTVIDLRRRGFNVGTHTKPGRIRRNVDSIAAIDALAISAVNPFEPDSRRWRAFNRYSNSAEYAARQPLVDALSKVC